MSKTLIFVALFLVAGTLLVVFFNRQEGRSDSGSKTPITKEEAIVIARDVVAGPKGEFVLEEDKTLEKDFGWVFFRTTKKYLESHNLRDLVPGVGPFVVNLYGEVTYLSSAMPLDKAIGMYQSVEKENKYKSPSQKIAVPVPIIFDSGDIHIYAPNNSENPSHVMRGNGVDVVMWEMDLASPRIDPNLERDVQLLPYFVTNIKVSPKNSKYIDVTLGTGINARTYTLDQETGEVVD